MPKPEEKNEDFQGVDEKIGNVSGNSIEITVKSIKNT